MPPLWTDGLGAPWSLGPWGPGPIVDPPLTTSHTHIMTEHAGFRYGEIVNINYVRDKATGKPKGFCFLCFEDQRSTILTVDNLNGAKVLTSRSCSEYD